MGERGEGIKKYKVGLMVKMDAQVNKAHVLAQPLQKLQLDYKTNITQNHQKIELYGSPTTKELKKSNHHTGGGWRCGSSPTPICGR